MDTNASQAHGRWRDEPDGIAKAWADPRVQAHLALLRKLAHEHMEHQIETMMGLGYSREQILSPDSPLPEPMEFERDVLQSSERFKVICRAHLAMDLPFMRNMLDICEHAMRAALDGGDGPPLLANAAGHVLMGALIGLSNAMEEIEAQAANFTRT